MNENPSFFFTKDYKALVNCSDEAYEPDCKGKAAAGLCSANLADTKTLRHYCQKSCGVCSPRINTRLSCQGLAKNCNSGICMATRYFGVPSIKCVCGTLAGQYCQRSKNKIEYIKKLWWNINFYHLE